MTFAPLRSAVERFLVDTCTITTPAPVVFDETTGSYEATTGDTVYAGRCWVRPYRVGDIVTAADEPVAVARFLVTLPWDTAGVGVDQDVTITKTDDPYLIGRSLTVIAVEGGSGGVYVRLVCDDTTGLAEGS